VLLLHDSFRPNTTVCITEAITNCRWTLATPEWEFWSWTIILAPVWSFDRQPVRHPLCRWWGIVEYHGPVAAERRATLVSWVYMFSFESERMKVNCAVTDILVNSCQIFTHLTYKWLEKL
jgi:hypothetical protein